LVLSEKGMGEKMTSIGIKLIHPDAQMPKAAHPGDAWDIFSCTGGFVKYREPTLIPTGIVLELPQGWRARIWPRSGLFVREGLIVHPGIIDQGFRGEVKVGVLYFPKENGVFLPSLHIKAGDRIAQLTVEPIPAVELVQVEEVSETNRGAGGFGSTGR
jgi:dUTP pyrophosphatase